MVSPAGAQIIKESPRAVYRRAFRDHIERQCLANPLDLTITGTADSIDHQDSAFQGFHNAHSKSNFKDVVINMDTKATALNIFSDALSLPPDHIPYHRTYYCQNWSFTRGTINGTVPATTATDKSFTASRGYSRGFSRNAQEVMDQIKAAANTSTVGGGSWGAGADASNNKWMNGHFAGLTEAQLFLTNEGYHRQSVAYANSTTELEGYPSPGGDFAEMMNNQWSYLVSAHGGWGLNVDATYFTGGLGGHLRIFALDTITIEEDTIINMDSITGATPNGGAGTLELIATNIIINKSTASEITAETHKNVAGSTPSKGGGGAILMYANSFGGSGAHLTDLTSTRGGGVASALKGDWIDEDNIFQRSTQYTGGSAGITRFYKIEPFAIDREFEFQ